MSASGNTSGTKEALSNVVDQYLQNIYNHKLTEAYSTTALSFQKIIPEEAFIKFFNTLKYTSSVKYEINNTTMLNENEAEVEIIDKGLLQIFGDMSPAKCLLKLIKEGEEWKICLDWSQFYSMKIELLPPIAEFNQDGVTITLKPIVLFPATKDTQAFSKVRLDIKNSSGRQLCWQLPVLGTPEGYLTDAVSNSIFYISHGYGVLANMAQDFHYIPSKSGSGTMLLGNNAEATLYIRVAEIIPDNVKELKVFLSGLSFCDNNEKCDVVFNDAPYCFEVVPNQ